MGLGVRGAQVLSIAICNATGKRESWEGSPLFFRPFPLAGFLASGRALAAIELPRHGWAPPRSAHSFLSHRVGRRAAPSDQIPALDPGAHKVLDGIPRRAHSQFLCEGTALQGRVTGVNNSRRNLADLSTIQLGELIQDKDRARLRFLKSDMPTQLRLQVCSRAIGF
jgi:hypothetical protein